MNIIEIKKGEQNNYTSTINIDYVRGVVEKIVDYEPYTAELFRREIFWLETLYKTGVVPKLLKYNPMSYTMTMEWCGEILSEKNRPDNVYEQLYNIHISLLKNNCFYNDWKSGNLLVKDGKITIIDFGWCPMIVEDYSCNKAFTSELTEKPAGNYFKDIFEKKLFSEE